MAEEKKILANEDLNNVEGGAEINVIEIQSPQTNSLSKPISYKSADIKPYDYKPENEVFSRN